MLLQNSNTHKGNQPHSFTKMQFGTIRSNNSWSLCHIPVYMYIYAQNKALFHRHLSSAPQPSAISESLEKNKDLY